MGKQQEYNIICHYPETKEGREELARRVAIIRAQAVLSCINKMNISKSDKLRLLDAIIADEQEKLDHPVPPRREQKPKQ